MVKVKRNPVPPASLTLEAGKKYGSYSEPDVIRQLKEDFHDKCYICELKNLSDPQVEHLRPHHNRKIKERVFDWNNLFYVCPHCNLVKGASVYDDKVLDCCLVDPEQMLKHEFSGCHVKVHENSDDEKVRMTARLIEECFEKTDTGIREAACQHRIRKLSDEMNILYKILWKYKENPNSDRYKRSLRHMLKRECQFAAFKRNYVREHLKDYPNLKEFV